MAALLESALGAGVSSIQIGSANGGMLMVRAINGAVGGMCTFSRENNASCVQSRGRYGGACAATIDSTVPISQDDCFYDPRYTEWYKGLNHQSQAWKSNSQWLPLTSTYVVYSGNNNELQGIVTL